MSSPDASPPDQSAARGLALVITFDQLPVAGLGCYGNEWVDTTAFDTLAADGFVFDANIAQRLPGEHESGAGISAEWLAEVQSAGGCITVIREPDSRALPGLPVACDVRESEAGVDPPATATDMPFGRLIRAAQDWLRDRPTLNGPTVLWLHSAGLPEDCLPPPDAWDLYADEFAEDGIDWQSLSDADILLHPAIRAAYLSLMDHWLGELLTTVRERTDPVLLQALGRAGWPWLPATRREPVFAGLEASRIQAPWVLWEQPPPGQARSWDPGRSAAIVQPCDLGPTLLEWLGIPANAPISGQSLWPVIRGSVNEVRDLAITRGDGPACSIWTPEDQVVFVDVSLSTGSKEVSGVQRFLQPEDPWNVSDVASQSAERIEEVTDWLREVIHRNPAT